MDCDVVIVGGGPTGLMLACELRLHGVRTVVLEQLADIDPRLKAGATTGRGVDALERRGLVERLGELPVMGKALTDRSFEERFPAGIGNLMPKAKPGTSIIGHFAGLFVLRGGNYNSQPPVVALQQQLEEMLEERATELGADLRRGHELVGFTQDDTRVTVTVEGPAGPYELRGGWLVGCDGGRSPVRKGIGVAFPGTDGIITGYQAVVTIADPDPLCAGWHRTERGLVTHGPMLERVLFVEFDGPPVDREAPVTLAEVQTALRRVSGTDVTLTGATSLTRFTDNARHAESYRAGRVLLAGDAAHVHSPFGGQGLNLGLSDAANLGWKLAAEVVGWAPDGLLDTYTTERRPAAERVLQNTRAQVALLHPGPHVDALREIFTELVAYDDANRHLSDLMGGVDIRYDIGSPEDHPLLGRHIPVLTLKTQDGETSPARLSHAGRGLLLDLADRADVRDAATGWTDRVDVVTAYCGEPPAEALLVRPDGYVVWVASPQTDTLGAALTRWFGDPR